LASVPLYLFSPRGTVQHFSSAHAAAPPAVTEMWVRAVAAGDVLAAYLSFQAYRSRSSELRQLAMRSLALYCIFHMGAFLHAHYRHQPLRRSVVWFCWLMLGVSGVGCAFM